MLLLAPKLILQNFPSTGRKADQQQAPQQNGEERRACVIIILLSTNFLHSYPGPCVVLASFAIAIGSQIGEPTYLYADAFWGGGWLLENHVLHTPLGGKLLRRQRSDACMCEC